MIFTIIRFSNVQATKFGPFDVPFFTVRCRMATDDDQQTTHGQWRKEERKKQRLEEAGPASPNERDTDHVSDAIVRQHKTLTLLIRQCRAEGEGEPVSLPLPLPPLRECHCPLSMNKVQHYAAAGQPVSPPCFWLRRAPGRAGLGWDSCTP